MLAGLGRVSVHSIACFTSCNFLFSVRRLGCVSVREIDDVSCLREKVCQEQALPT